jgi:cytochrome P450
VVEYRPFDASTWRDPWTLYAELREHDPVHRAPGGYWVLTRFDDVWAAARDTVTYSSAQGLTFHDEKAALGLAPTIVMMDPPDHTAHRRLVSLRFVPREVAALEPALREQVRACLDELCAAGGGDFVAGLARPVPCWVVAHYLGVPEQDRGRFAAWTDALVSAQAGAGYASAADALAELYGYFTELVERRRREPGDDLVSALLAVRVDDEELSVAEILGYAFVMVAGGNDTTIGLLSGAAELLTAHPQERRRLLADRSLIPGAVDELLRLTSPVQGLCRVARRDTEVAGTPIAEGDRVLLCYGAANRDPREFGPTAEQLDVGRTIPRMLAFSSGPHHCLGAAAARLQGRVVLEELLARCPGFTVDAAEGRFAPGAFTRRYERLPFTP